MTATCEVRNCPNPATGTVTLAANASPDGAVTWEVCGRHLARCGSVLLTVEDLII